MTLRERWLAAGMSLLGAALAGLFVWQHLRYADAQQAIRGYVALEGRAARANEGQEQAALAVQARPEVRGSLVRGDFSGALKRLAALDEEDDAGEDPEVRGDGLPIDALWPQGSGERQHARDVLRELAEKQAHGYDLTAARESLVEVARAARAGRRDDAMGKFSEVQKLIHDAALRPGFRMAAAAAPPGSAPPVKRRFDPRAAVAGLPNGVTDAQLMQFLYMVRTILPMRMDQVPPEHRETARRLQALGDEAIAAQQAGKDLRPARPLIVVLFQAVKERDFAAVERLIPPIQSAIRAAKPLPARSHPARPPAPRSRPAISGHSPVELPGGVPGQSAAKASPAASPPAGPGPAASAAGSERVLQALDAIRKLPDPEYRQRRAQLPLILAGVYTGRGGPGLLSSLSAPVAGVGDPAAVRLALGSSGEVTGLHAGGQDLSTGLSAGGLFLASEGGGEESIRTQVRSSGSGDATLHAASPEGAIDIVWHGEDHGIRATVRLRRTREGRAAEVGLRLPVRAAGWRWSAGDTPQVIAADGSFSAAAADGRLAAVLLRGPAIGLRVQALTAKRIAYNAGWNWLEVRLPLPATRGAVEHEIVLSLAQGGP